MGSQAQRTTAPYSSDPKNVETALMYTGAHGPSETTPIEGVLASDTLLPQSPSPIVCPLCR